MIADLYLSGLVLGIVNAAPVGPVGLLCLRRNLVPQRAVGLAAAGGMAVAYAIIAFCAVAGLRPFGRILLAHEEVLQAGAGILLVFMGWRGLRPVIAPPPVAGPGQCLGEFSTCFALTLFNPVPFATFALILSTFPPTAENPGLSSDLAFAVSVAAGTAIFWIIVNEIIHRAHKRSPDCFTRVIAKGSSILLLVFGAFLVWSGVA